MGKIIIKNAVKRKDGYLYYIDGKGNVCESKLSRAGRPRKNTITLKGGNKNGSEKENN